MADEGKHKKTFKICQYNHMFGGNGRCFKDSLKAHYNIHFGKNAEKILEKSNLNIQDTMTMIEESQADVFGLCEVLGDKQAEIFQKYFLSLGYKSVYGDMSHKKKNGLSLQIVLATKKESVLLDDTKKFPRGKKPSQSGGILHVYIPELDTHILHCHLVCPFQVLRLVRNQLQVVALEKLTQTIQKKTPHSKIIVMGDFNVPRHILEALHPSICSLNSLSDPQVPTYIHPVNKNIKFIIDGIFGYNIESHKSGVKEGKSDHRLVWAKVRMDELEL